MRFKNNLALFLQVANYVFSLAQRLLDDCPFQVLECPLVDNLCHANICNMVEGCFSHVVFSFFFSFILRQL